MRSADITAAVALARATVGAADDLPAVALVVRRLDREADYVLVHLGHPGKPGWVAAVDPAQAEVMTWAVNESGESTTPAHRPPDLNPGEVQGQVRDDLPAQSQGVAELVWRPSAYSMSPLYPLLRITIDGEEVFVDLAGAVHDSLPDGHA